MISPRQSAALHPLGVDFDRFLYAPVGDDPQGERLSVVSALARLGVDPWDEAARLARMPVNGAVQALSTLLAGLPAGPGPPVDPIQLATHLISLLPRRTPRLLPSAPAPASASAARGNAGKGGVWRLVALVFVVFILLLLGMRLLGRH